MDISECRRQKSVTVRDEVADPAAAGVETVGRYSHTVLCLKANKKSPRKFVYNLVGIY